MDGRFQGCCRKVCPLKGLCDDIRNVFHLCSPSKTRKVCPLKGLFWTFQVFKSLSDFPFFQNVSTTILIVINNHNKTKFHKKSQNFFEKSRGFFCLFFENFALIFVINNIKQNQNFFKNILIIFENFCFYFVIKIRKNKFIYTFKKGAYYV